MTNASSEPVRLTIVYEPDEHGHMTATVPAFPGTTSAGRNRPEARENLLDALRLMLSTPPERLSGRGQFVEELEVSLDVFAATSAAMGADLPFVYLHGELVAIAGRTRCHLVSYDLDPARARFIAVMCLCKREVEEGRLAGPFTSEVAERWARLVLIRPHNLNRAAGSDEDLARRLGVPPDQLAVARAEMGHPSASARDDHVEARGHRRAR